MSTGEAVPDSVADVSGRLVEVLRSLEGLRAAYPAVRSAPRWLPWDPAVLAVDLDPDVVEIRLVATALPLPARLDQAEERCRAVLAGTRWAGARLRLVVVALDASALGLASTD